MPRSLLVCLLAVVPQLCGCPIAVLGAIGFLQTENDKALQRDLMSKGGEWNLSLLHVVHEDLAQNTGDGPLVLSDETFEGGMLVFLDEKEDSGIRTGTWTFDDGTVWDFDWDGIETKPSSAMPKLDFDFRGEGGRFRALEATGDVDTFSREFVAFTLVAFDAENDGKQYTVDVELDR
jgi:hypothetical protein